MKPMRTQIKDIDWAFLLKALSKEMSISDIARQTGLSRGAIHKYISEKRQVDKEHDKYAKAMLLFLDRTDVDIPVVGQYFEEMEDG